MAEPFRFTAETNIQAALEMDPRVGEALRRLGLKCVDKRGEWCVAVEVENFADAARYHEIDLERILEELNRLKVAPRKP
jgi:hypothetical protein